MLSWPESSYVALVQTQETKWNSELFSHLLTHALCPLCPNWCLPSSQLNPSQHEAETLLSLEPTWGPTSKQMRLKHLQPLTTSAQHQNVGWRPCGKMSCICAALHRTWRNLCCHQCVACKVKREEINQPTNQPTNMHPSKIFAKGENENAHLNLFWIISFFVSKELFSLSSLLRWMLAIRQLSPWMDLLQSAQKSLCMRLSDKPGQSIRKCIEGIVLRAGKWTGWSDSSFPTQNLQFTDST